MVITGYARCVEQDIVPEDIIAPAYAASGDPAILAAYCLHAVDPTLAEQIKEGDILVVVGYVHTGVGAEAAVFALQAVGIVAIICAGVDAPLAVLAGAAGLPILVQPDAALSIQADSIVRLNLERGTIDDQSAQRIWRCAPTEPAVLVAMQRMLLFTRMRRFTEDEGLAD
jgi:3-isopropylmalate/(R)-2-methylmalate dehydratase small subunit